MRFARRDRLPDESNFLNDRNMSRFNRYDASNVCRLPTLYEVNSMSGKPEASTGIRAAETGQAQLAGKVAIVTGAGSGMGEEISREFARQGASVVCLDIKAEAADAIAADIKGDGGNALAVRADVSKPSEVQACVAEVMAELHQIDVLVNCAGINFMQDPTEITPAEWDRMIAVNLDGPWFMCQALIPIMKAQHSGKIVNIASGAGLMGMPKAPHYVASKHGLIGLTRALAADLGPFGINVNAICPAATMTPLLEKTANQVFVSESIKRYPLGRLARPLDIAKAALFLASPSADFITGVALPVDGGFLAVLRVKNWE